MITIARSVVALGALLAAGAAASAIEPARMIDAQLRRSEVQFVSVTAGKLRYFDDQRTFEALDMRDAVRIEFTREADEHADTHAMARLIDGHVVRGRFEGVDADDRLLMDAPGFDRVTLKLDDLAVLDLRRGDEDVRAVLQRLIDEPSSGANDLVVLNNGDQLRGFVDALGKDGLTLTRDEGAVTLRFDTIAMVRLANPVNEKPGVWVETVSGSRVRVEDLTVTSDEVTGKIFGAARRLEPAALRAIDFAERYRLTPVRSLRWEMISGGVVFGVPTPPRFANAHVHLHAPIAMRFDLPYGSVRFAARAALERDALDWADLILRAGDGQGERDQQRLNAETPEATVNIEVRDRTLTLTLEDGVNGPIRDRLELHEAVVLVDGDK